MTPRTRKAVAVVAIALVLCAAFLPALATALGPVVFVPLWIVVPAVAIVIVRRRALRSDEQPVALLSLVLLRAPPSGIVPA
jgi:hypothetical protein